MKHIFTLIVVAFLGTLTTTAQEINWVTLEEASKLQEKEPRKIIMDMYTNWCGPCKLLDKMTFHNKDVVDYINKNYYAVKFNAEGNDVVNFKGKTYTNPGFNPAKANRRNTSHQLASYFSIRAYPTIVFLDEKGEFIAPISGYKQPQQLELYLKMFKKNEHLQMDTQQKFNAYYKAFKPEFSN